MTLFLKETLNPVELTETISIEDAYTGLFEAANELAELNEGLLLADFHIHQESFLLTEEEQEQKEKNFFGNAIDKIKAFLIRTKDKIVAFFQSLGTMIKRFWEKLVGRGDKKVEVTKGIVPELEKLNSEIKAMEQATINASTENGIDSYKQAVVPKQSTVDTIIAKVTDMFTKTDTNGTETIDLNRIGTILGIGGAVVATGALIKTTLDKDTSKLDQIKAAKVAEKAKQKEQQASIKVISTRAADCIKISGKRGKLARFITKAVVSKGAKIAVKQYEKRKNQK